MARQQDFITLARQHAANLLDSYNALKAMQLEATVLDYTNSLEDGVDANAGITKDEVIAVVFTTTDAIKTLLEAGHGTNLAKLL